MDTFTDDTPDNDMRVLLLKVTVLVHMISDTPPHLLSLRGSCAAVAIRWGEIATPPARNDKIGYARHVELPDMSPIYLNKISHPSADIDHRFRP